MKQQIIPGQSYQWLPELTKGLDGKFYNVFTMFASGRGWAAKRYLTPKDSKDTTKIIVRALHTNSYVEFNKNVIGVTILKGFKLKVLTFNKRPYVRKSDGKFSVTHEDDFGFGSNTLGGQYGVHKITDDDWEIYEIRKYYKPDVTAGLIVQGKVHYLTNILNTNGNLIEV